jgi:hypothetical protein
LRTGLHTEATGARLVAIVDNPFGQSSTVAANYSVALQCAAVVIALPRACGVDCAHVINAGTNWHLHTTYVWDMHRYTFVVCSSVCTASAVIVAVDLWLLGTDANVARVLTRQLAN